MSSSVPTTDSHQFKLDGEEQDSSKSYALSGKIMLSSIIVLFVVVVFLVLLHLYARWYLLRLQRRNEERRRNRRNRSTRVVFYVDSNNNPIVSAGLDASVLKGLPLFVYSSETHGKMPECAVCLSEFDDGEKGRILPKCRHSFHTECIDMWFHSNSTCPLCRSPVEPVESETTVSVEPPVAVPEPGSSTSVSSPVHDNRVLKETSSSSMADRRKGLDIRIDVPSRNELVSENEFRLPSPSQGFRSPGSRLLALKRIISMSRKSPAVSPSSDVGPSCLPVTESDLESACEESALESNRIGTGLR